MIDLKDFTIDELLSIYTKETSEDVEMTTREYQAWQISNKLVVDYLKKIREKRIIELPIPLYSVVYAVTEERAFDYSTGKQPTCENQLECNADCELNGHECKMMPFIEQKIYVPNSIWFDYISNYWGQSVFGTLREAVEYINNKYGFEFCKEAGLPAIDENGALNIPGLDPDSEFAKAYAGETFGKPVLMTPPEVTDTESDK